MKAILRKFKKLFHAIKIQNIKAVIRYIKNHGFKGLYTTCLNKIRFGTVILDEYKTWMVNNEPSKEELEKQRKYVSCQNLKFELVVMKNTEKLQESIHSQTYSKFVKTEIQDKSLLDIATNSTSDYLVLIGENIILPQFALYELVKSIEYRDSIMIYADNDTIIEGERKNPNFKPDFAKDTLTSENYLGNFLVIKTDFLKVHPNILENLHKNIIYDLAFRISEKTRKIEHIQKVLFHNTTTNMEYDTEDEKKIIADYLKRCNLQYSEIIDGRYEGQYKVQYTIIRSPKVSIIIPNKDHIEDLEKAINSILEKSTYENYEIVIVENNSEKESTFAYYKKLQKEYPNKIRVANFRIDYFNYSAVVNFGVEHAEGEYVILLNNDIEIISRDWIEQMLMYAQRKDVGICGAKLYFPDRSIQHAGVTIGTRGLAGHRFREIEEKDYHRDDYINIVQNVSAVTAACFMVRKDLYIELLGFDEKLAVAFNDVDFCLKVRTAKYLIVYNPYVEAYHYESKSRGQDQESEDKQKRFAKEYELFVKRWSKTIQKGDPYYNKNYRLDTDLPKINYNKIH